MNNILINTDSIKIPVYGLILVTGTLVGIAINTALNHKTLKNERKTDIEIYNTLLSLICTFCLGELFTVITSGFNNTGFSSIGGLCGMYLAYFIMSKMTKDKETKATMLLNLILVIPLIYSLTKVGCLFGSCCYGIEYSGALSVEYIGWQAEKTGAIGIRFPVQLVETITFGVIFIAYCLIRKFAKINSTLQATSLCAVCAIAKFSLDFLRDSHIGKILSTNQVMCIIIFIISIVVFIRHFKNEYHENNVNNA